MKLSLRNLKAKNFKGCDSFDENFGPETIITGKNEAGKTTIADMFYWLLLDTDSISTKNFSPKPIDTKTGEEKHRLDTEVEGIFDIDGVELTLKKVFKEKWTRKRGDEHDTFTGHETTHFIDGVPVTSTVYQTKIAEIIDKEKFKMLTAVNEFCTMPWQKRRDILLELGGSPSIEEIIASKPRKLDKVIEILGGKSVEDRTKIIKNSLKLINEEKIEIPARIDELNSSLRPEIDNSEAEKQIQELENEKQSLQQDIDSNNDKLKANGELITKKNNLNTEIYNYESTLRANLEKPYTDAHNDLSATRGLYNQKMKEIGEYKDNVDSYNSKIESLERSIKDNEETIQGYRDVHKQIRESQPNLNVQTACPTCGVPFKNDDVAKSKQNIIDNFVKKRDNQLASLVKQANEYKERNKHHRKTIEEYKQSITKENEYISKANKELEYMLDDVKAAESKLNSISKGKLIPDSKLTKMREDLDSLNTKIEAFQPVDISSLRSRISEIDSEISKIRQSFSAAEYNKSTKERIEQLSEKLKDLSTNEVMLEGHLFKLEEFVKERSNIISENVNKKFKFVKFSLFRNQVNGGVQEVCDVLVKGVSYHNGLNNAARINAGLEIIDMLSKHYKLSCPIFIDNSESVNKLIDIDNQLIKLRVTTTPLKVKIEE